jgi:ParB family transcriptional regulator, chromosome partitioning protein
MLRLLTLPDSVKAMVDDGRLSAGHARALIGAKDVAALAENVALRGLSVRETETLASTVKKPAGGSKADSPSTSAKDADTRALERDLSSLLGLKVTLDVRGQGGTVAIHYRSLDQLDDVLKRLKSGA